MNFPAARARVKNEVSWQIGAGFWYDHFPPRSNPDSARDKVTNQDLKERSGGLSPYFMDIVGRKHAVGYRISRTDNLLWPAAGKSFAEKAK